MPAVPMPITSISADRPSPAQVDEIVSHFEQLRDESELADERYDECRDALIALVHRFGIVPVGAEQSLRLQGQLTIITVTIGNTTTIQEDAVTDLKVAMVANGKQDLFNQMFGVRTKHELLKDAAIALRTASLPKRLAKLFTDLYGRCTDVKKKSPSLKIERLDLNKAAKKSKKAKAS
jgi:hypothetical protein